MVVRCMPSPAEAQKARLFTLVSGVQEGHDRSSAQYLRRELKLGSDANKKGKVVERVYRRVEEAKTSIARCNTGEDAEVVVFISKMMPVRTADLSKRDVAILKANRDRKRMEEGGSGATEASDPAGSADDLPAEVMVALARVFSGVLKRDSNLYLLGHRHDPVGAISTLVIGAPDAEGEGGSDADIDLDGEPPTCFTGASSSASASSSSFGTFQSSGAVASVTRVPAGSFGVYICLVRTTPTDEHPFEHVTPAALFTS
jgi:hypothetical protein